METMKLTVKWTNQDELRWWAEHLLRLSDACEYDDLMHFLNVAREEGYLSELRQAAEQIVKERQKESQKVTLFGVKKAKARKSGLFRAVA